MFPRTKAEILIDSKPVSSSRFCKMCCFLFTHSNSKLFLKADGELEVRRRLRGRHEHTHTEREHQRVTHTWGVKCRKKALTSQSHHFYYMKNLAQLRHNTHTHTQSEPSPLHTRPPISCVWSWPFY